MKIQFRNQHLSVFESALFRTTSSLIETEDFLLLVDPNWLPMEIEFIQQEVKKKLGEKPLYLLFTHSDYDHIIGYKAFDGAQVIASQEFVDNKGKEKILEQINDWDDENYIKRAYPILYPEVNIPIQKDGQQLKIGSYTLTFYLAPGHNQDSIFTIIEPLGIWIAGDYLSNIEFPYIYFSSHAYEKTLAKVDTILATHPIQYLITGHGDMAFNIAEIQKRKKESLTYIQELRTALQNDLSYDFSRLMQSYQFPKIMKAFHDGNVKLMKKEIELDI
jgi:glyoxylase-like metal-dependent hydrolase (beta-lactamase superfamily II)